MNCMASLHTQGYIAPHPQSFTDALSGRSSLCSQSLGDLGHALSDEVPSHLFPVILLRLPSPKTFLNGSFRGHPLSGLLLCVVDGSLENGRQFLEQLSVVIALQCAFEVSTTSRSFSLSAPRFGAPIV